MQLSNAHEHSANGMVEKMVGRHGRMLRATLLQSQMPPEFWGATTILLTDIYNCTPHTALDNETPYYRQKGVHPDLGFFRPFGCKMIVHQGKDLVEHHKLAPRGEKCVYLGCGMAHGPRCSVQRGSCRGTGTVLQVAYRHPNTHERADRPCERGSVFHQTRREW